MFKWKSTIRMAAAASLIALSACSDNDDNPSNPDPGEETSMVLSGSIDSNMTLTADEVWELEGLVYVESGVTLTVEPGTEIKSISKSALIVKPGGKLMAEGTVTEPIIFTSKEDSPNKGDWAGIVIMGNAPVSTESGDLPFEANPEDVFGGDDASDNSGTLKYVRIEYAGWEVAPEKELNGLTLGGVGSGTELSYIHVHEGQDDGIEWFGGTVNSDHLLVTNQGDDGFDIDVGYAGTSQYMLNIQDDESNSGIEAGDKAYGGKNTIANWSNITLVDNDEDKDATINIKDNVQINLDKIVMIGQSSPKGLKVSGDISTSLLADGTSSITNAFYDGSFTDVTVLDSALAETPVDAADEDSPTWANVFTRTDAALDEKYAPVQPSIQAAEAGAIVGNDIWYEGWSTPGAVVPSVTVEDENIFVGEIDTDMTLDASKVYGFSGFVYLKSGVTLTIPAGTQFRSDGKSALIVEKGAFLIAEGTADKPVVFTSAAESPQPGDWAGIVIMGNAPVSTESGDLPFEANPEDVFGGTDVADSSGSLKYVRIEYAGWEVAPEKELNGLTMGGVGSKTVVSYVQVHEGQDDGFEWFGGTVNADHIIATAQGDDGFDVDVGYAGSVEYALNVQDDGSNSGIEAGDKAYNGENTMVTFSKVTLVDNAEDKDATLNIKENVQVNLSGVVMVGNNSPKGLKVATGGVTEGLFDDSTSDIVDGFYTGTFTEVETGVTGKFTEDADAVQADGFTLKSTSAAAAAGAGAVVEGDTWHTGWTTGL